MDANLLQTCGEYEIFSQVCFTCKPDANLTFAKNLHAKQTHCESEICYKLTRDANLLQMSGLRNVCTRRKAVANIELSTCLQWVCTHRLYGTHRLCNKFTQKCKFKVCTRANLANLMQIRRLLHVCHNF